MKTKLLIIIVLVLIFLIFWWWFDYGSWHEVPIEYLTQFTTDFSFRNADGKKVEPDMWTWYSYFSEDSFSYEEIDKMIFEEYNKAEEFDFTKYTYILSFGFTIEQLLAKGDIQVGKHNAKVVHGLGCLPNSILLYRIPHCLIYPNPDRRSTFSYRFLK